MRKFILAALAVLALAGGVAAVASFEARPALACSGSNC
jgi:Prokaryotic membrane lipoprotein lipid attachment site